MSSESPDEQAETVDPADSRSAIDDAAGDTAASATDETDDDRSYEQRVLDELVPEISVGDEPADPAADPDDGGILNRVDGEPATETPTDEADSGLADALDELDEELQQAFIRVVVGIKAGVLLSSAGVLAIGFQGLTLIGGGLILAGGLAFAHAGQRYWAYEHASDRSRNG